MKNRYSYIILLCLLLTSTLFGKIPKWVLNNSHPEYQSEQYFIGIGISETRTEAEDIARANLIKEISVKIESELENRETETMEDGKIESKSEISQRIKTVVAANLVGVQIAEIKKHKDNYYALAVLSKLKYFTTLEIKMDEIGQRIKNLMNDSDNLQEEGFLLTAIKNYQDSKDLMAQYVEKTDLYTALTGRDYGVLQDIDSTSIQINIQRIITNTILQIYQGENQTGISGHKLPETVIIKAIYKTPLHKEVPVQNLPVLIKYENGEKIDKLLTGVDGKIRTDITAVPTDETGKDGRILFKGIFDNVKADIQIPEISLKYNVETTKVTYQVKIENSVLRRKISGMITENGYSVSDNGDFVITAKLSIIDEKEIESPFGVMYMVKVSANINMYNKSTNKIIASMKATGRATDKTVEKTQKNAYGKIRISKKNFIAFLAKIND